MLNVLRDSFKNTPYLKWVLIAVGASMVLSLGYYFTGDGSGSRGVAWVARVGDTEIPDWQYRNLARQRDQYYRNLFGESYEEVLPQLRLREQALNSLIENVLILQDAERLGLTSSDADLVRQIRSHPSFQDASGQFIGIERYRQIVERGVPGGVSAFERTLAEDLVVEKWTHLVTQPVTVTDQELAEIFRQRTVKTAVDYFVVATADQAVDDQVTDEEARAWYDGHLDDYQRGEARRIRYVVIDREAQLARVEVTPEELQAYYEANQERYAHPEQRRARHILIRVDPAASEEDKAAARGQAEGILERVLGGEDFATLARALSQDPDSAEQGGELAPFARGTMFESFEAAVFDTAVGQYAPLTETPHGFHVIQVTEALPAGVTPLAEVEESIRRTLELVAANDRVETEADRLRAEAIDPESFGRVAEAEGLQVESRLVVEGDRLFDLGAAPEFITTLEALVAGEVSAPLPMASGKALVVVDEIIPAGPAPFEEVREQVDADVLGDRRHRAAVAAAKKAREESADLASAARSLGLEVQSSSDLSPGQALSGTGGTSPEYDEQLFGETVELGQRGVIEVPSGALVYEVSRHEPFDPVRFEQERPILVEETLNDRRLRYRQAVLNQLRARTTIEIDAARFEAIGPARLRGSSPG